MDNRVTAINPSFKSGLTKNIRKTVASANVSLIEKQMKEIYGINADFKNNKAIAICFKYIKELLDDASAKFNLHIGYNPPSIRVFEPSELLDADSQNPHGFCICDKYDIIRGEKAYEPGAIFIKNIPDDIDIIDKWQDLRFYKNHSSSSHFLGLFMHEWFHSIHLDRIFKKYGYAGISELAKKTYPTPVSIAENQSLYHIDKLLEPLNKEQEKSVLSSVGKRASENCMELFAETMVKIFTDTINKDKMIIKKNPMSKKEELPFFIKNFIDKEFG